MNKVLSLEQEYCGELLEIKKLSEKTIPINQISIGRRFQFEGDVNRVREVLDIDEEYVLIKTIGCTEDYPYYKCHFTHLKINETSVEEFK